MQDDYPKSRGRRGVEALIIGAAAVVVGIALLIAAVVGLFALLDYRSAKVTGQSDHAARAWPRIHKGMTDDEVKRLAGEPSARHDACWTWGEGWVFDAERVYRVCFVDGSVARKSSEYNAD